MLWTDYICLCDLYGASSHAVPTVVGCGTPHAVHQLLIVLHDGVPDVVAGKGVASMVRTAESRSDPGLWPEWGVGEADLMVPLPTP